jgi:hypothetical protein
VPCFPLSQNGAEPPQLGATKGNSICLLVGAKVRGRPGAPSRLTLCLVGASSQLAGGADELLVARRSHACGTVQRVLEADAGVEAPPDPVRKKRPRDLTIAMLEPRGREAELIQRLVDILDQPDGVGGLVLAVQELELSRFDQDPGEPITQP